jgi:hypothetical protein
MQELDRGCRALYFDEHALCVVAHVSGQPELGGQAMDERAEAHALDDPDHPDAMAHHCIRNGRGGHAVSWLRRPNVTATSRCIRPKL